MTGEARERVQPGTMSVSAVPDRFEGIFRAHPWRAPERGDLLDHPPARAWLELIHDTCREDRYTFQAPLHGRAGPRVVVDGRSMILLSSYDYLGLIGHPRIEAAAAHAIRSHGTGTGGVRLLTGTTELHLELESEIARFKGTEAALTFTSGYLANLGAIAALLSPRDRVVADERIHRSLIDACRLARVKLERFRHNDCDSLEAELARGDRRQRTLVVVEGVYSMDGDVCRLPEIVEVKNRHGAHLMVDEAHSFGALGRTGRGIDEYHGVSVDEVDLWMGSLSKAIPSVGGFLAGRRDLMFYLQHGAASYMFSAALSPPAAGAALEALRVLESEPERLRRLVKCGDTLRDGMRDMGFQVGDSQTAIVPVFCGSTQASLRLARALWEEGVLASAVIPPAVPPGASRLRLCATAAHVEDDLSDALDAVDRARRAVGHENGTQAP